MEVPWENLPLLVGVLQKLIWRQGSYCKYFIGEWFPRHTGRGVEKEDKERKIVNNGQITTVDNWSLTLWGNSGKQCETCTQSYPTWEARSWGLYPPTPDNRGWRLLPEGINSQTIQPAKQTRALATRERHQTKRCRLTNVRSWGSMCWNGEVCVNVNGAPIVSATGQII